LVYGHFSSISDCKAPRFSTGISATSL
jgi:hypothetical protein